MIFVMRQRFACLLAVWRQCWYAVVHLLCSLQYSLVHEVVISWTSVCQ